MTLVSTTNPSPTKTTKRKPLNTSPTAPGGAKALANIGGEPKSVESSDFIWTAEEIGREIGRSAKQVYHLHHSGALDGAVRNVGGHDKKGLLVGSRRKLRELLGG